MNDNTSRLILALALGAALAMPSTALARHGADDDSVEVEHAVETETHSPGADDPAGHDATPETETETETEVEHQDAAPVQRTRTYQLRGSVVSSDAEAGTIVVTIRKANHGRRGRVLAGETLTFDVSGARFSLADVNGDGEKDAGDVAAGDRVEVRAKLARSLSEAPADPVAALRVKDRDARA